jgi:PQQ enzyme repeat
MFNSRTQDNGDFSEPAKRGHMRMNRSDFLASGTATLLQARLARSAATNPELAAKGMTNTGTENYGGPIVTAGGLVVIGATVFDNMVRAYDSTTGTLLWQFKLPYAAAATPTTYMVWYAASSTSSLQPAAIS